MLENIITDDQKIDEIYRIVKKQEARERRSFWLRLLWKIIFLVIIILGVLNFQEVVSAVTRFTMPLIKDVVQQTIQDQGNAILDNSDALKEKVIQSMRNAAQ